jgi:type III secretory pathway component EscR
MKLAISNFLLVMFLLVGCGKKEEAMTNEEKISGKSEKTWKATRETNAAGEKDKLTREEKKESITFSRNGNVKMSNEDQVMGGTWSFMDNTLSLQFTGTNVTENFKVTELSEDKIKLLAEDGSQMTLESD